MSTEKDFYRFFYAGLDADETKRHNILVEAKAVDESLPARLEPAWANQGPIKKHFPTELDDFRLGEAMWAGTKSVVYRARQISLNREVAVKFFTQHGIRTESNAGIDEADIQKEVYPLTQLQHENIAVIHGSGCLTIDNRAFPFLVMSMEQGLPLDHYLANHRLSLTERLQLMLQICDGLQYCHAQFINHCNLKPANLLVSETGNRHHLRFVGFDPFTNREKRLREDTAGFLSSEAATRVTVTGVACDIIATGAILKFMLADMPQEGKWNADVPAEDEPVRSHHPDKGLDALYTKATHPDLGQRYQTIQDLADEIRAWLDHVPERWFYRLFAAGLEADENTRQMILADAQAVDKSFPPRLRNFWVNRSEEQSSLFAGLADVAPFKPTYPEKFGDFHLQEEIGAGGMGVVFKAWQLSLNREVAVKFLTQRGFLTESYSAGENQRIMNEARLLAQLNHDNIVKIHEIGCLTIENRKFPYLVMPLEKGLPLDLYLAKHHLPLRERLQLLLQVCDGLQHSHAQFINHRDLKPSNILVSEDNGRPRVRIIDFGLAAKGDEDFRGGTKGFLPPEAKAGQPVAGVASDIFATGVTLHLMLADGLPKEGKRCSEVAKADGPVHPRHIRGDLDALCAKATHPDPRQRYQTVQDLAGDIRAWLNNEPLCAVPRTRSYLLEKYVRRRRSQLIVALITLMFLAVWTDSINDKLKHQKALERSSRQKAKVHDILLAMFHNLDPSRGGLEISVRDLLLRGEKVMKNADYADDPVLRGAAYLAMSNTFEEIGMYEKAAELSKDAVKLFDDGGGYGDYDKIEALRHHAFQLTRLAQHQEARRTYEDLLSLPQLQRDPVGLLKVRTGLAGVFVEEQNAKQAIALLEPILTDSRKRIGPNNPTTLAAQDTLARALVLDNRADEALALFADAHRRLCATLGANHPRTLTALNNFTWAETQTETLNERRFRDLVTRRAQTIGPGHPDTLESVNLLGNYLYQRGRRQEAADLFLCGLLDAEFDDREIRYQLMHSLGNTLKDLDQCTEAETLMRNAAYGRSELIGQNHPQTLLSLGTLVEIFMISGRQEEAHQLALEVHETALLRWGPEHRQTRIYVGLLQQAKDPSNNQPLTEGP